MDHTASARDAEIADGLYTKERFEVAFERYTDTPALLTVNDFSVLGAVDPTLTLRAKEAWNGAVFPSERPVATRLRPAAAHDVVGASPRAGRSMMKQMKQDAMEVIADAVVDTVKAALASVLTRLTTAEQRVKDLEAKPLLKYAGVWKSDATYPEGRLVTHAGGLWLAVETTSGTPGTYASGWRLIVKRGQA